MVTRRIQIVLAFCVFLTAITVYHNARYMFYSVVPFFTETKSAHTNASPATESWFSQARHVYNGYQRIQESYDNESFHQLTLFISTSTRGEVNGTWSKQSVGVHRVPSPSPSSNRSDIKRIEENKSPIHILLLSYQRSGSSIISSLFGDNAHIFFLYEPLDSVYTALYGLSPGWSVPTDLTINRDGTLRKMPSLEKNSATELLQNIYECEFDKLPTEFFIHPFWWYFRNWTEKAKPYVSCLRAYGLSDRSLSIIQRSISVFCGRRFGDVRSRQEKCIGRLWPNYRAGELETVGAVRGVLGNVRAKPHQFYGASLKQMRKKCEFCVRKYLKEPCKKTQVRAIKTVRGTMDEAEVLLEKDPNFKVIHLLRDPRGVTRSRVKAVWSRGFYDAHKEQRIAHVYCTTALYDYMTSERLRAKYPGRLIRIVLEDFISQPEATLADLSNFLRIRFDVDALQKLYKRMTPGFTNKWRKELSRDVIEAINKECDTFMTTLNITQ